MTPRPFLLAGLLLIATAAAAQDTPIAGARVAQASRTTAIERITLENRRESPLVAFQIGVSVPGAASPAKTYWADYTFDGAPTSGAVGARQRRTIQIDVSDQPEATAVTVMLAEFADGHCEGRAPKADSEVRLRMPCTKTADAVTSIAATSERDSSTRTVAVVQNLRDVPLEAFAIELVPPGKGALLIQTTDYCGVPHEVPAPFGPIQPQESREVPLALNPPADAELRLTFVLFHDLAFEGRRSSRDDVLKTREQKAASHAFAIAALKEAITLPEAEVVPFLERKRGEWLKQVRADGARDEGSTALYDAITEARREPKLFPAFVKGVVEMLESTRQDLLKHKQSG